MELGCGHSFCQKCCNEFVNLANQQRDDHFLCPQCRCVVSLDNPPKKNLGMIDLLDAQEQRNLQAQVSVSNAAFRSPLGDVTNVMHGAGVSNTFQISKKRSASAEAMQAE